MPVASLMISRIRPSPCGPWVIEVSVQWKTMRSGATSASSLAEVAISSAIAETGRCKMIELRLGQAVERGNDHSDPDPRRRQGAFDLSSLDHRDASHDLPL